MSDAGAIGEYDDPNAITEQCYSYLQKLGIDADFAPLKLRSGCGDYCAAVLRALAEAAAGDTVPQPHWPVDMPPAEEVGLDEVDRPREAIQAAQDD